MPKGQAEKGLSDIGPGSTSLRHQHPPECDPIGAEGGSTLVLKELCRPSDRRSYIKHRGSMVSSIDYLLQRHWTPSRAPLPKLPRFTPESDTQSTRILCNGACQDWSQNISLGVV